MAEKYKLKGVWMNSCSCDAGCPCLFFSDPTRGTCDGIDTFHIESGNYGTTKLDGLNVVLATRSPGNIWKGNWRAALYLDKRADAKQKPALETLFTGKAGGVLGEIGKLIGSLAGTKWADIKIDPKARTAEIPGILRFKLEPVLGGDQKTPIRVENNPFGPAIGTMSMGKATNSTFQDYDLKFDNAGKDCNWANFEISS